MMKHMHGLGKRRVAALLVPLGVLAAVSSAAAAAPRGTERAWQLLEQGDPGAALHASLADRSPDERLPGIWIETVASMRSGAADADDGPVRRAARAFEARDFASCTALLDSLADVTSGDAGGPARPGPEALHLNLYRGACWVELGRIAEADSVLSLAVDQARELGRPVSEALALIHRGRTRVRMRQTEPPRRDLLAALDLCERLELPAWAGRTAIALSVVSRLQMDLDDALQWREKALTFYQRAGDLQGQATATHYIGTIDLMRGDLTRAMIRFQEALSLARRSGDTGVEGAALGEMASVNFLIGDFDQALSQYGEAIRLSDNPWRRGAMLINIGSIHEYRGDFDQARPVLEEAVALMAQVGDHRTAADALRSLGETLCESRQFAAGLDTLDRAIALAREYSVPYTEAYALKCKGHGLLDSGDLDGAADALDAAARVARRIDYFDVIAAALRGQAMVARRRGDPDAALAHLLEALDEVAEVRRRSGGASPVATGFVGEAAALYDETIDVMYELHRRDPARGLDRQAFAVAQQAKARAFLDQLVESEFDLNHSAIPNFAQQESEILTRIVELEQALDAARSAAAAPDSVRSLRARLATAEDDLQLLAARLRAEDPRYAEILYPAPLDVERLAGGVLGPDEVLLDYALGDSASYVWAVGRGGVTLAALPSRAEIEALVREYLPLLRDYNLSGGEMAWLAEPARRLYETLVAPVAPAVAAAERVIVSPDGILHYLPFEALLVRDRVDDAPWPWLITQKVVTITPSASVLERVRRRPHEPAGAPSLLLGDPILEGAGDATIFARAAGVEGLAPLPRARDELAGIAAVTAPGTQVLTREAATAAALAAAAATGPHAAIHFATHGLFNEDRPRWSGLVLTATGGDDGFLSASSWDWTCRATRSCCRPAPRPWDTGSAARDSSV